MFTVERAAKFLVVAWVKQWDMRALLETLDERGGALTNERCADLERAIPFMSGHAHWYACNHGGGVEVRQYVADLFPNLSQALWGAKDNAARLRLAPQIERLRANGGKAARKYSAEEYAERKAAKRAARQTKAYYDMSRAGFKTHGRSAWNVCKA
jgi:hypothetical protein